MAPLASLEIWSCFLCATTFILGVTEIVLERHTEIHFPYPEEMALMPQDAPWHPDLHPEIDYHELYLYPPHLSTAVNELAIACGALAIATGVIGLTQILIVRKRTSSVLRVWCWSLFASTISVISAVLAFTAFTYAFVQEYTSSVWSSGYTESQYRTGPMVNWWRYPKGRYTRESWLCQMESKLIWPIYDYMHLSCMISVSHLVYS